MLQNIIFACANGSIYALMALAIGMIYSTTGISNFAHAAVVMLGALTSNVFIMRMGMPIFISIVLAVCINILVNIVIYKACVEQVGDLQKNTAWIVTLFGASILIENIARMWFGTEPQVYPYLFDGKQINVLNANIKLHEIMMIVIALTIGIIYQMVIQKSKFGRAVRAVSYNPSTARLMGIKSNRIVLTCFALSGTVAAIAGSLIAPITFAGYTMTSTIGIKGFAAALLGGLGNTLGAFIGGIIIGLVEMVVGITLSASFKDAASFLIMIIVIIFLPGGVLGAGRFSKTKSSSEKV